MDVGLISGARHRRKKPRPPPPRSLALNPAHSAATAGAEPLLRPPGYPSGWLLDARLLTSGWLISAARTHDYPKGRKAKPNLHESLKGQTETRDAGPNPDSAQVGS
jgi:hypothetical protein